MPRVRAGAALGDDEECIVEGRVIESTPLTLPAFVLQSATKIVTVSIRKESATTRIGIGLAPEEPDRAIVNTTAPGTPASMPLAPDSSVAPIQMYDELLEINGVAVESAVHAVKLIREAPAGELVIRKRQCPESAQRATIFVQAIWRAYWPRRDRLVRRVLVKPTQATMLGLGFSPDFSEHSVIKSIKEDGLAARTLNAGDRIMRINGRECTAPAEAASLLRQMVGHIEMHLVPAAEVDLHELEALESQARAERQAEAETARVAAEDEGEGEDGDELDEDDDDDDDDDDADDQRAYGDGRYLPRPAHVHAGHPTDGPSPPAARRLPASLGGMRGMNGGPPLASGRKPEGWRDWLKQRRSAAAVKARDASDVEQQMTQRI